MGLDNFLEDIIDFVHAVEVLEALHRLHPGLAAPAARPPARSSALNVSRKVTTT